MEWAQFKTSVGYTWIWISALILITLGVGIMTFSVVSHKGDPSWDYRPVKSLPAESPYAEYEKLPYPQHIKGKRGE